MDYVKVKSLLVHSSAWIDVPKEKLVVEAEGYSRTGGKVSMIKRKLGIEKKHKGIKCAKVVSV
jgi:hypothetical protein